MKWSFDDNHIGRTRENKYLETRVIPRPGRLTMQEWYEHASAVCKELNRCVV